RVFDARRHVVDPALQHRQPLALVAQPDRVVLLPTRTAEVDGIEPPRLISRQELLTIEDDPALAGAIERRVGDASAADELVELEREERLASTATRAGPVAFRRRRDEEEFPQGLGAPVLRTSRVPCERLRRLVQRHRPGADPLPAALRAREPETGLHPDG